MAKNKLIAMTENGALGVGEIAARDAEIKKLRESGVKDIRIDSIRTRLPFSGLFEIDNELMVSISESIRKEGFDRSQPIFVKSENLEGSDVYTVIDGHTRLRAVQECNSVGLNLESIPCLILDNFTSDESIINYMRHLQFFRRNIGDSQLVSHAVNLFVKDEEWGAGREKEQLAEFLNISPTKAMKILTVIKKGREFIEDITEGKRTINSAYNEILQKEKAERVISEVSTAPVKIEDENLDGGVVDIEFPKSSKDSYPEKKSKSSEQIKKSGSVNIDKVADDPEEDEIITIDLLSDVDSDVSDSEDVPISENILDESELFGSEEMGSGRAIYDVELLDLCKDLRIVTKALSIKLKDNEAEIKKEILNDIKESIELVTSVLV